MAGCGFQCAKYTLFFFNAIFWLIGCGILAVGIWLAVDTNILEHLGELGKHLENVSDQQLKWAAYFLIAAGGVIFIIGFCGCCGAIRESQCLLGFYAICILGIIGLEIAAGVFAYLKRDEIIQSVTDEVKALITDNYDGSNAISQSWHKVMVELKCCGAEGPLDWEDATKWTSKGVSQYVPKTCCILKDDGKDPENPDPVDNPTCQIKAKPDDYDDDDSNVLHKKGCVQATVDWLEDSYIILIAVAFAVAAFELLVVILALCVCCQIRRKE